MELLLRPFYYLQLKIKVLEQVQWIELVKKHLTRFLEEVRSIGVTPSLGGYEKRKLRVFNQLNFLQFLTGILVSVSGLVKNEQLASHAWLIACLPAMVSLVVLYLNKRFQYEYALLAYFIL